MTTFLAVVGALCLGASLVIALVVAAIAAVDALTEWSKK